MDCFFSLEEAPHRRERDIPPLRPDEGRWDITSRSASLHEMWWRATTKSWATPRCILVSLFITRRSEMGGDTSPPREGVYLSGTKICVWANTKRPPWERYCAGPQKDFSAQNLGGRPLSQGGLKISLPQRSYMGAPNPPGGENVWKRDPPEKTPGL